MEPSTEHNSTVRDTMQKLARSPEDTGSPEVQIALLTSKINILTEHFKKHKKDYHSKRGLLKMVSRRKKLLNYIRKTSPEIYQKTLQELSLRK